MFPVTARSSLKFTIGFERLEILYTKARYLFVPYNIYIVITIFANGFFSSQYDATQPGKFGGGGEYAVQEGFGWTNGVVLEFLNSYPWSTSDSENSTDYSECRKLENSISPNLIIHFSFFFFSGRLALRETWKIETRHTHENGKCNETKAGDIEIDMGLLSPFASLIIESELIIRS